MFVCWYLTARKACIFEFIESLYEYFRPQDRIINSNWHNVLIFTMIEIGWLVQVSKALKKLHHLQFLIDWLASPPCNQLTAPPSQIDTFQTTLKHPASNPTFRPIGNNLFKSDPLRPRHCNFCSKNQMDRIGKAHACTTVKLGLNFNFGSAAPFLCARLHPKCNLPI